MPEEAPGLVGGRPARGGTPASRLGAAEGDPPEPGKEAKACRAVRADAVEEGERDSRDDVAAAGRREERGWKPNQKETKETKRMITACPRRERRV